MVPRQLIRLAAVAASLTVIAVALAPAAEASNRRISISNYQWSDKDIHLDLGEHVTWYWVGPDTMHSVTGDSPNTLGLDSDTGISLPHHNIGDSYRVDFAAPGTYSFVCKLHSTVRGTITVSNTPGDPASEQDPVPKSEVDLQPPRMRQIQLTKNPIRGRGGQLQFAFDDRGKIDADYYKIDAGGTRHFAGWAKWKAYIGLNEIRFGGRGDHFRAQPGRYVAELRGTDSNGLVSEPRKLNFKITAG